MKHMNASLSPEKRAELLLGLMSIEEKMGQVTCLFPHMPDEYKSPESYDHGVGQVSSLEVRAMDTLEECACFQRETQERIMALSPNKIPAIFHMEGLCGALIQEAISFPSGIGRGSTWNPKLEEDIGRVVSRQECAVGITQTLAPVLDIARDPRMGRQGESYGEDQTLAAAMGAAYTKGLQGESTGGRRTDAAAKHFAGSHQAEGGIHGTHAEISERALREVYCKPFQAAITEAGLKGIMPCYNSIGGEPVSASKRFLTELLRDEMGFEGVTVSDYCAVANIHEVQKVCESLTEAGLRAMEAGMDTELFYKKCYNDELCEWFKSGKVDVKILDQAVLRILTAKFRMGLFENPFALTGQELRDAFHHAKDAEISLQAARESLVLLKNDGTLPISSKVKRVAVIGCHAATARFFFGGYTHFSMAEGRLAAISTMAGLQSEKTDEKIETYPGSSVQVDNEAFEELMKKQKPGIKSLIEQLRDSLCDTEVVYAYGYPFTGDDMSGHDEALKAARNADFVILTLGGKHGTGSIASMSEGVDASCINLPPCQEIFIEKLAALNKPVAAVHFDGRPISSNAADNHIGAILEAWSPSEMGAQAIVDVLTGKYNPGGKLPVSVARHAGQIPVYYNHPNGSSYHQGESIAFADYVDLSHKPRYFFGHGLSYTNFAYSKLALDTNEISPNGQISICADIENIGDVSGDEVVQLYIKDRFASMTRPVTELAGFKRIHLQPGEKKTVCFKLKASQLAFLDREMRWKIEAGDYDVLVGVSSDDIRLRGGFRVTEDRHIEGKSRGFYAQAKVL
ncbi:MAG: glycoside hydrolase family 3 C-terminal domain-containing protein [Oscillospiraceae bacterium]|nr:glycoside hydrolase family 3 C-terminal domain-containing protein [Oscillospiraceae bacterium]